jgi:hypothetical protein
MSKRKIADDLEAEYLAIANGIKKPAKIALEPMVRAVEALRALETIAPAADAQGVADELASMTRMFHAACADLGLINETLGLDPDDGGAAPIIEAIAELKSQIAAPAEKVTADAVDERAAHLDLLQEVLDAKEIMLQAGCAQAPFAEMFAQFAKLVQPSDAAAEPVAEVIKWRTFTGHDAWDFKVFDKTLKHGAKLYAAPQAPSALVDALTTGAVEGTKLAVWYGSMPESNGKSNWTAILHNGDIASGITLDRSEYPDRVRYEADRARWLIGELPDEPFILDYDADKHSGYTAPSPKAPAPSAEQPLTNAELANAASRACACRTAADGWIFENVDQLRALLADRGSEEQS